MNLDAFWTHFSFLTPERVSAVGSLLSGLTSVALAYLTFRLVILTRDLAKETRLTRESRDHAEVRLSVEPHTAHISFLELVVANVGQGTAEDLKLTISGDGVRETSSPGGRKPLRLASLLPGSRHRIFVASSLGADPAALVLAKIEYSDTRGRHEYELKQEIGGWFGFSRLGRDPTEEMASALRKISDTMKDWSGFQKLQVDVYSDKERQRDQDESEARLRELKERAQKVRGEPESDIS